jgi:DNA-binding winged helix-turn-helix (wHTH) protein/tetratricopeptide (TPR) repeat protein
MDALHGSAEKRLTNAELAAREDFKLGEASVSPSTRKVSGPGGSTDVEPRIMQVLVVLADAAGRVVTRDSLFERCWGGVYVGDDSLNRAVAAIRRLASDIAGESFEVETVRRTGYRLRVTRRAPTPGVQDQARRSRRLFVGGAVTAAAIAGGMGAWTVFRPRSNPRFEALRDRGAAALRLDDPAAAKLLEQAVAIEPHDAKAWGLLAYALGSGGDSGPQAVSAPDMQEAERAARTALTIDPNESNALLTMTFVESGMLDWLEREERYRRILAIDPGNTLTLRSLGQFLHSVGRCREALAAAERALSIEPLFPDQRLRKALRLWVLGSVAEADQVIDRAMELWPSHRLVRLGRLMIYAFTGRARAALAMVEDEETRPILLSASAASVWRASLVALDDPTASNVAAASKANLEGSKATSAVASLAILVLSALGDLDAAFQVADGFLLGRGSIIVRPRPETDVPHVNGPSWRNTYGLFTPPTKAMRLDNRFHALAQGLGLTEYWSRRGIGPDAFLFKA